MDPSSGPLRGHVIVAERRRAADVRGRVELVFRPDRGRTALAYSRASAPLGIVRPFALDGGRALVQIVTLGPGLCGGDTCTLDVAVQPGARAIVMMQTASRILGMSDGECATQTVNLVVAPGGQLEYYPGLTIPFADSHLEQRVTVSAHRDSRVGILESWSMGRATRHEYLRFRRLSSRTVLSIDGQPVFADALEIQPEIADATVTGILENHRYVASGFWYGVPADRSLTIAGTDALLAFDRGVSREQVFLRALARDGYQMATSLQAAVDAIDAAWDLAPIPLKRFAS
jgi:urease accessory protein